MKKKTKFFVYCFLLLVLFIITLSLVFSFKGKLLSAEILVFLFLMLLALLGFLGYHRCWGERILFFVFLVSLGNLVFVWYFTHHLFLTPLFLSLLGFLISLPKTAPREMSSDLREEKGDFDERKDFDFEDLKEKKKERKKRKENEREKEREKKENDFSNETEKQLIKPGKKTTFPVPPRKKIVKYTPGKYVASKSGRVYHVPLCEWAKKITPEKQRWFKDEEEAKNKGYQKHKCVP